MALAAAKSSWLLFLIALPSTLSAPGSGPAVRRAREPVILINAARVAAVKAYVDSAFGPPMSGLPMEALVQVWTPSARSPAIVDDTLAWQPAPSAPPLISTSQPAFGRSGARAMPNRPS